MEQMSNTINPDEVPDYIYDRMCRTLDGVMTRLFSKPEVQEDFKKWEKEYERRKRNENFEK